MEDKIHSVEIANSGIDVHISNVEDVNIGESLDSPDRYMNLVNVKTMEVISFRIMDVVKRHLCYDELKDDIVLTLFLKAKQIVKLRGWKDVVNIAKKMGMYVTHFEVLVSGIEDEDVPTWQETPEHQWFQRDQQYFRYDGEKHSIERALDSVLETRSKRFKTE